MAVQTTTEQWDTAWSLIDRAKKKRVTDNYFNKPTLVGYFMSDAQERDTGGKEIEETLEYAGTTGQWFSNHDTLPTSEPDIITACFVKWAYFATPAVIAFDTENESRNASKVMTVLEARQRNAIKSIKNDLDIAIATAKTGKACLGLQDWVADLPTSGTIAGINRATYSFWRNQYGATSTDLDAYSAPFFTGINYLNTVWNTAADGDEGPDAHACTLTEYGQWENMAYAPGGWPQYVLSKGAAPKFDLFAGMPTFHGGPVIMNRNISSGHWYMLNSNALMLRLQSGIVFDKTPFRSPHNQLTKIAYVVLSCQMVGINPRRTAVVTTLT